MTRLNCTITASDDNNLIFETRGGRGATMKVITRDGNAATELFAAVESAIKANDRPVRQPEPAAPAPPTTPGQ